jgi:hypothetical protein
MKIMCLLIHSMATTTAHTNTTPARVQMIMIIVCDTGSFGSGVVECCGVGSTVVMKF